MVGETQLRIIAVHPFTPVESASRWRDGLDDVRGAIGESTQRLLVVGDFNACYWHRPFRDILAVGVADAHCVHGRGLSMSWPTDLIPFVRLDHALTAHGLRSTAIHDFAVPGSDHRGFVVTVS